MADVSIAIAGATGGVASGIMVAATSYPALVLPAVAATAYRR